MLRFLIPLLLVLPASGCGGCSKQSQTEEISADGKTMVAVDPSRFDAANDWPWWRGPSRDGNTGGQHAYPLRWSESENVIWKTDIPGKGLGSPIVVGNRVFLPTSDPERESQSVLCYDRSSGKLNWHQDVHQGSLGSAGHLHSTYASSTLACDGQRVFAAFRNDGQIWITALDLDGKKLWQTPVAKHTARHGFGGSPVIYKQLVIISGDSNGYGFIAALHRKTGDIWWRKKRSLGESYSSPVVANVAGKDQLLLSGGNRVVSYDPMTGEENWNVKATAQSTCGTVVWKDDLVFASGGHPQKQTVAINAEGGKIVWKNSKSFYVSSMLVVGDKLFGFSEDISTGFLFDTADGSKPYRRLRVGGTVYGSPVLAGGYVYVPLRNGGVAVLDAESGKRLALNHLGFAMDTSPTPAGGRLFLRVIQDSGTGQEMLYCIGKK